MSQRIKILLVDDRPENLIALENLVKFDDTDVIKAHSGSEALSKLLDHHFALILLDVQMPDIGGFEVAELIRGREQTKNIPIIFVTAQDPGAESTFQGYERGAVDFLHKPLKPEVVRSKVRVFITLEKQRLSLEHKIDELHLVNQRVMALKEEAEAANAAKSAFIANVSHEIRTPMSAILGFAEMLTEPNLSAQDRLRNVETIIRNGNNLLGIINDILDVSKAESGKISIEMGECNLVETIYNIRRILFTKSQALDVEIDIINDTPLPETVVTDPKRLEQILINVLTNAVKFSEGGKVTLGVSYNEARERLDFRVVDTGIGIAPEAVDRIFQPFGQADDSSSRRYGGTGLGLALSKRLAGMLGGDLVLQCSEPGKGSTFVTWVTAKVSEKHRDARIENLEKRVEDYQGYQKQGDGSQSQTGNLEKRLILLVDDSEDNRVLVQHMLRDMKSNLDIATNGKEALSKTLHKRYDLILMDIQMPEMDGYETLSELRSRGYDGPIVALTAHAMAEERSKCLEKGFDNYLSKPFKRKHLLEVIGLAI